MSTKLEHAKKNRDKLKKAERCINGAKHPQPKIGKRGKRELRCERCKQVHRKGAQNMSTNNATTQWMEGA